MANLFFKWLTVPQSNETKQVEAVQLWEVRWESRHGPATWETRPELETFTSESSAQEFAQALRNAYRLIRHTSGAHVSITKARAQ